MDHIALLACEIFLAIKSLGRGSGVIAFAPQAEGWMFESQPRQTQVVKLHCQTVGIPLIQGCFVSSSIETGSAILKKINM